MTSLRGLGPLTRAYLRQSFRSRTAIIWNVVMPLFWLFLYGFIFARDSDVSLYMPGLFSITVISGAFFGASYLMVSERETGILRRYRVTPVNPLTLVLANGIRAVATMSVSLTLQATVGWLVFRYQINGSLLLTALVMLIGAVAFVPLGLFVGSVAQDMRTAPGINNLVVLPMIFSTGAAVPFFMLPDWIQLIGRMLPSSYLVEALHGVMLRNEGPVQLAGPLLVLLSTAAIGALANSWVFRWESSQPLDKRRLLMALSALLVLWAGAALLVPAFGMAVQP